MERVYDVEDIDDELIDELEAEDKEIACDSSLGEIWNEPSLEEVYIAAIYSGNCFDGGRMTELVQTHFVSGEEFVTVL